ncbi:hypothetical protein KUCAC02_028477 [Chaenocephalus aceratus]|uniref:Uncharacterized protein n=1 Tax=Chaenocephalus aceratus TaxID=36190 RepID=A0ACB9X1Y0_CHAAC|nr:hypothetical protein KUCAC02_028477 [Chaenocephalus aceratus]
MFLLFLVVWIIMGRGLRVGLRIIEWRSVSIVQISITHWCQKTSERDHSHWQQRSCCHLMRADEEYETYQLIFPWSL